MRQLDLCVALLLWKMNQSDKSKKKVETKMHRKIHTHTLCLLPPLLLNLIIHKQKNTVNIHTPKLASGKVHYSEH